jgi:hypothetical protein
MNPTDAVFGIEEAVKIGPHVSTVTASAGTHMYNRSLDSSEDELVCFQPWLADWLAEEWSRE